MREINNKLEEICEEIDKCDEKSISRKTFKRLQMRKNIHLFEVETDGRYNKVEVYVVDDRVKREESKTNYYHNMTTYIRAY